MHSPHSLPNLYTEPIINPPYIWRTHPNAHCPPFVPHMWMWVCVCVCLIDCVHYRFVVDQPLDDWRRMGLARRTVQVQHIADLVLALLAGNVRTIARKICVAGGLWVVSGYYGGCGMVWWVQSARVPTTMMMMMNSAKSERCSHPIRYTHARRGRRKRCGSRCWTQIIWSIARTRERED